jgi:lambda repressor-like predicted transcriptional regulator
MLFGTVAASLQHQQTTFVLSRRFPLTPCEPSRIFGHTVRTVKQLQVVWNAERLAADMAIRGWNNHELARRAGLSYKTVERFVTGETQTSKTAVKLATALGYSVRRYFSHVEAVA